MQNDRYKHVAELFSNDLYDELIASGILNDPDIICWQNDGPVSLTESKRADHNFILWSLIPYIAACSGEKLMDKSITFKEEATIRPDGAHNICHASVIPDHLVLPDDYVYMRNWCGPMWNDYNGQILWQIVILANKKIQTKLLDIGEQIKVKYNIEFNSLKEPYAKAVLESVPSHLKRVEEYELQFVFHSDGLFLLYCITELLKNGKLKRPAESQKKILTTLIIN